MHCVAVVALCCFSLAVVGGLYLTAFFELRARINKLNSDLEYVKNGGEKYVDKGEEQLKIINATENSNRKPDEHHVRKIFHETKKQCRFAVNKLKAAQVVQELMSDSSDAETTFLQVSRPMAHLTARKGHHQSHSTRGEKKIKYWHKNEGGSAFLCSKMLLKDHTIAVPEDGRYYVYSQVKFNYDRNSPPTLHRHTLYMWPQGDQQAETKVVENNYYLGNETETIEKRGNKISHHGMIMNVQAGSRFLVKAETGAHSNLVTGEDADTFFGMYMVS